MHTVIFGATGYLGSHVAEQLAIAGHTVHCAIRESSDAEFLEKLKLRFSNVSIVRIDFSDQASIRETITEQAVVINCVAETRMHLADDERRKVEVGLTTKLFKAAEEASAKRFLQLSTVMVYGFERPEEAIDERYPCKPRYSYSRVAVEREQALMALAIKSELECVILRPSNTLGKRDSSALPSVMQAHEKGMFAVIGGGAWNYSCIDARDVGRAMEHLLTVPVRQTEVFLVKAYDMTWLDLKEQLDTLLERPSRLFNLPRCLAMAMGRLLSAIYPYGSNPALTPFTVSVLSTHTLFDDSKIRATGFQPKYHLVETLQDALEIH